MTRFKISLLFVWALLVASCAQEEPTPAPTLAPTSAPTSTPAPTATDLPPTSTTIPTEIPQPTETPEPSPTPIPARELIEMGDTQLLLTDWQGAEEAYRQAIANEPENGLALARLAYLLQFHPQTLAEAVEVGRDAAELAPNDPVIVSFFILTLIRRGEFDEALVWAEQIEPFANNNAFALGVLSDLYLSIGEFEQADQYFKTAIIISSFVFGVQEVELNRIFARNYFFTGNRSGANQYSTRLMENAPNFAPAFLVRSEVVTSSQLGAETQRELIIDGLILDADYPPLMVALAQVDAQAGNYELGLDSCEDVIRLFPDLPDGLLCLGDVLLQQGMFEEAGAAFDQVFQQGSSDYRAFIGQGQALIGLGDCETAEGFLLSALVFEPYAIQAFAPLAEAYQCQGKTAEAEAAYEEAFALRPFDSATHFSLGKLYLEQNRAEEAKNAFLTAILNSPAGSTPADYFVKMGESLVALNECSPSDPPELAYYLCSGDLFSGRGAPFLAVSAYSLALEIDENSVPALEGLITAYASVRICDVADSFFTRLGEITIPSTDVTDLMGAKCFGIPPTLLIPNGEIITEDEAAQQIEAAVREVEGVDDVFVFFDTIVGDDPDMGEARVLFVQFISDLDRDDPDLNRQMSEMVFAAVEGFVLADSEPIFLVIQARVGLTTPPTGFIVPRFSAIGWHNGTLSTGIFRQTWTTFDELAEQIEEQG